MSGNLKPGKSKKYLIYGIIAIIVLSLVVVFLYRYVKDFSSKRVGIARVLDKNTSVYNSTTDDSKQMLVSLKSLLDFTNLDDTKVQENISQLDKKIPEIKQISANIAKSSLDLEKGDNADSSSLFTTFNEGLATKQATIDVLGNFVTYEVCLVKNASTQYANIAAFSDNLTKFSQSATTVSPQDKSTFVDAANKKISDNIELSKSIEGCFQNDSFSKYLTPDMKQDIAKDIELYNQYVSATKGISEGLLKSNSQLLQESTGQLLALKDKNPVFYTSEGFKKSIQDPKKLLQDQAVILENQEKRIKNDTVTIKSKYFLD